MILDLITKVLFVCIVSPLIVSLMLVGKILFERVIKSETDSEGKIVSGSVIVFSFGIIGMLLVMTFNILFN